MNTNEPYEKLLRKYNSLKRRCNFLKKENEELKALQSRECSNSCEHCGKEFISKENKLRHQRRSKLCQQIRFPRHQMTL